MIDQRDRREYVRTGYDMPISFSLSILEFTDFKTVEAYGRIVDKSENGLGISTDYPLEPGHVIRIRNDDGSFMTASVKWVGEIDGKYRIGVLLYK